MSIEYYSGTDGPTIDLRKPQELYEAIDILHTQVIDNLNENRQLLTVLEVAMQSLDDAGYGPN